ncbi:MAG: hypothetical protein QM760_08690 [Nibricoccus sp.]
MPSTGVSFEPCTLEASSVPSEGSDARERSQREGEAHQQRPDQAALARGAIELRQQARRQSDFECAEQAKPEDEKDRRDEAVHPRIRPELHDPERSERRGDAESDGAKENDDAEAENDRLEKPALLLHKKRNRNRDHRENARRKDRGEAESERDEEESGEVILRFRSGGLGGPRSGSAFGCFWLRRDFCVSRRKREDRCGRSGDDADAVSDVFVFGGRHSVSLQD